VYENDIFDVDYGLADSLVHKPNLKGTRGPAVAYYAIAKFNSGGHAFIVMTHDDMTEHRDRYAPKNKQGKIVGPWVDNFEGMALKTTIRRLAKYMPKSTELNNGLAADGGVRVDTSPAVAPLEVTRQPDMWDGEVVAPVDGPVDGATEPEDKPQSPEPAQAHPLDDVQSKPRLLTQKQKSQIMVLSGELGLGERDARIEFIAGTIDRPITSSTELTSREASKVIDVMLDCKRSEEVRGQRSGPKPLREVAAEQSAALRSTRGQPSEQVPPDSESPAR
jgi:hypothetical protein